jgi:DNA repair photolyase
LRIDENINRTFVMSQAVARIVPPKPTGPAAVPKERRRGRGTTSNPAGRFEPEAREAFHDGWELEETLAPLETTVATENAKTLIARNESPDISFDRSINPYRGCEHGCVYCFARPTHSFLGMSAGLDFETKLTAKVNAAEALQRELSKPGYEPKTIALGTATDPYQPIERQWTLTRQILEVLDRANHPVGIVTKSALVTRDIDILARMAERNLVKVAMSVTTLDHRRSRTMEPRAATPKRRLDAMQQLSAAGVPVMVMVAPVIPALNDHEIEAILEAAHEAGAREAGWVLLRLPYEVRDLVQDWLIEHEPGRYRHVMNLVRAMREGKDYDSSWGKRMSGEGPYAWMIGRRVQAAMKRLGYASGRLRLDTSKFQRPSRSGEQLRLF